MSTVKVFRHRTGKPRPRRRQNQHDSHGIIFMTLGASPDDSRVTSSARAPRTDARRETGHDPRQPPQTGPRPPHRSTPQEARPAPHPRRRRRPDHDPSSYGASRTPTAARTTDGIDASPAPERDRSDHWHQAHSTVLSNARTEGYNRLVKQVKRAACGFRNPANSARRIRFHCTRKQRAATLDFHADCPVKIEEPSFLPPPKNLAVCPFANSGRANGALRRPHRAYI